MNTRAARTQRFALTIWILLAACVATWPFADSGIGWITAALAFLPLLLPLPGMLRSSRKALRAAPMALAPALALALTESLANPPARAIAGSSLALVLIAFAAIVAALRTAPRD